MNSRTGKDIWRGLYDFYLVEKSRATKAEKILEDNDFLREVKSRCSVVSVTGAYKHILSHQTIITRFVIMESPKKPVSLPKTLKLYSITKVKELPKPVLVTRFLTDHKLL
jgi:A/G-specific adenine glycosylase